MILWMTALHNFRKTISMNFMTILQTTASLVLTAVMVSSISIARYYYEPFQDYFESKGLFCRFSFPGAYKDDGTDGYDILEKSSELMCYLDTSAEEMITCHNVTVLYHNEGLNAISYEDEVLERFQPDIADGRWLETSSKTHVIEVVISENAFGWKLGDTIELNMMGEQGIFPVQTKVVGILKEGARIVGMNFNGTIGKNYLEFYTPYHFSVENEPILLFSYSALNMLEQRPQMGLYSNSLIRYADDVSDEVLRQDQQTLATMGCLDSVSLVKLDEGSKAYIYQQMYMLLPILLVLLVLVLISSISSSALSAKRRLKDYALYYIVGLEWKQCLIVNFFQSVLICTISVVVSITTLLVLQHSFLQDIFRIIWNRYLLMSFATIIFLQFFASMLIPMQMLHHTTPKQILTNGRK